MRQAPSVDILLATYNNDAYLEQLLNSLLTQTFSDFRLIVSDDCSVDRSVDILQAFESRFAGRMELHLRQTQSGSAKANFGALMELSTADYALFADADDVWDQDKVGRTVEALQRLEEARGHDVPVFVFSDVRLIDGEGRPRGDSYWRYKKIRPETSRSLNSLLVCPPMLGCASGVNAALMRKARPVPVAKVTGHDWWLILVARAFGEVGFLKEPTMSYRLHGSNSSDQKEVSLASYAKTSGKLERVRRGMELRRLQAEALLDQFASELPQSTRAGVEAFVGTERAGFLRRRTTLLRGRYVYADLPRNLAMLLAV